MSINGTYSVVSQGDAPMGTLTVSADGPRTVFELDAEMTNEIQRLVCMGSGSVASIGIPVPRSGRLTLTKRFSRAQLKVMGLGEITKALLLPLSASLPQASSGEAQSDDIPESEAPYQDIVSESSVKETAMPLPETKTEAEAVPSEAAPSEAEESADGDVPLFAPHSKDPEGWEPEDDPGRHFSDPSVISACRGVKGALCRMDGEALLLAVPISESAAFPLVSFLCFGSPAVISGRRYIIFTVKDGMPV